MVAPFDGNGSPDIAVVNTSPGKVTVLVNDRGDLIVGAVLDTRDEPSNLAFGDFDGDGDNDLVVGYPRGDLVSVFLNITLPGGPADFAARVDYTASDGIDEFGPVDVAVADLDGDGDVDIATANRLTRSTSILLNDGSGVFGAPTSYSVTEQRVVRVELADLDGDGDVDIGLLNESQDRLDILENAGDATFSTRSVGWTTGLPTDIEFGDLDGDGDLDAAIAASDSGDACVLLGEGDGSFLFPRIANTGDGPTSLSVADFDLDGDPDVVVTNERDDAIDIRFNSSGVSWSANPGQTVAVGDAPSDVETGDLDNDGWPDIVIANTLGAEVSVVLNNANGSFSLNIPFGVAGEPTGVTLGDYDGDGDLDIAASLVDTDQIALLINNGLGVFPAQQTQSLGGTTPRAIASADVDGDGDVDIATANGGTDNAGVLLNDGAGNFGSETLYPVGINPQRLAFADINLDGDPDLIVATTSGLSTLLNNGDGTFAPASPVDTVDSVAITLGDIDGDSTLDLVAIPFSEEFVLIYPGNGDGTFDAPRAYDGGDIGPADVAVTDVDSDGSNDMIVANEFSDRFSTLINQCPPPPAGCNDADLAEPFGSLNFFDIVTFLGLYGEADPSADLAEPFGVFNFFDLVAYLAVYNQGC